RHVAQLPRAHLVELAGPDLDRNRVVADFVLDRHVHDSCKSAYVQLAPGRNRNGGNESVRRGLTKGTSGGPWASHGWVIARGVRCRKAPRRSHERASREISGCMAFGLDE